MVDNDARAGMFRRARPVAGDLVDQVVEGNLRGALFGEKVETSLGRLRIEGPLGGGAMGAVVLAFDPVLDRHVAVKSLRAEHAQDSAQLIAEARLLAKLEHTNVVSIYDVIEAGDTVHLVMERAAGSSLRAWIESDRRPSEVVSLFTDIGHGLAAAHRLDIAHCDVKPENIVVDEQRPMLIDFGLAFEIGEAQRHGGTAAYLAPERLAGGPGSAAADQYAFFASLYEALEGQRPDRGGLEFSKTPKRLRAIISRGLSSEPTERFGSMNAVVSALQPRRESKLLLGASIGGLTLSVAAVAIVLASSSRSDERCGGSSEAVGAIWNSQARSALGAKVASGVVTSLEQYLGQWSERRTASCRATRIHAEQSEKILEASMRCFDRRLRSAGSVIEVLSNAPNQHVLDSAEHLASELEPLEPCTDRSTLARAVPPPTSRADNQRLTELEARYQAIVNLDRRGEFTEARQAAGPLAAEARALGYAPFTARILVTAASIEATLGDAAAAEVTLREAATAAAKAKDDSLLAETWIRLLELLAQGGRHDEALTLAPVASASAERAGSNGRTFARLQNTLGGIYLAKGRYAEAHDAYSAALSIQLAIGGDGNRALAPAIANLGLAKWYRGDLAGALADQREALALMVRDLGPNHASVAYTHQNVGDLVLSVGHASSAEAKEHYHEALRIWTAALGPDHANLAHPLVKLASIAARTRDFESARSDIAEARRIRVTALGADHPLVLETMVAEVDVEISDGSPASLETADALLTEAAAMKNRIGEGGSRYSIYIHLAAARLAEARGQWRAAFGLHKRTLAERRASLGETHMEVAGSHAKLGRIATRMRRYVVAAEHFLAARKIFDANPGAMDEHRIQNRQDLAALELAKGNVDRAIAAYRDALKIANAAKSLRALDVRFNLTKATHRSGDKSGAIEMARELAVDASASSEPVAVALAAEIDAWVKQVER